MKGFRFFLCIIIFVVSIAGCGTEVFDEDTEEQTSVLHYTVHMQKLPDPDAGLADSGSDPRELDYRLAGDVLYRLVSVTGEDEQMQIYLQTLAAPYEVWSAEKIDFTALPGREGKAINGWGLTDSGEIYVTYYYVEEGDRPENMHLVIRQENTWAEADALPEQENSAFPYTADTSGIYRQEGEEQVKLLSWSSYGFSLYDAPMLSVISEEQMLLAATVSPDYQRVLLFVGKGQASEKQKITLAVYSYYPILQTAVTDFNRENEAYEIVVRELSQESGLEARESLQMEFAADNAPDLVDSLLLDIDAYARRGYLEPLDDWLQDQKNILPQALEYSRTGEHYYIAPFGVELCTVVTTGDIAGGRSRWTLEEMLETARSRETTTLFQGASAAQVLAYLLQDEENPAYIDWENKCCHFETDEFVELLKFARAMEDSSASSYYSSDLSKAFAANDILISAPLVGVTLESYYNDLNILGEDCVLIGYPMESGNGSYVVGSGFAVNQASSCKEGAIAFLEYLLDPVQQMEMAEEGSGLPVNTQALQAALTVQAKALAEKEENAYGARAYDPQEAEQFLQVILHSRAMDRQIDDIFYILEEEMAVYCQEDKDPWEVARILQNRVQLYLDEQY